MRPSNPKQHIQRPTCHTEHTHTPLTTTHSVKPSPAKLYYTASMCYMSLTCKIHTRRSCNSLTLPAHSTLPVEHSTMHAQQQGAAVLTHPRTSTWASEAHRLSPLHQPHAVPCAELVKATNSTATNSTTAAPLEPKC